VSFLASLAGPLIDIVLAVLWARWSKLDLGLRSPDMEGAWGWCLLYVGWFAAEHVVNTFYRPIAVDPAYLKELEQLSVPQDVLLSALLGPLAEELLFRGAAFSALMRRWGPTIAVAVPSLIWGLIHVQYEAWSIASIAGSGVVLAVVRWRSRSIYPSLALHAGGNLLSMMNVNLP